MKLVRRIALRMYYGIPLALLCWFFWNTCMRYVISEKEMVEVPGMLTKALLGDSVPGHSGMGMYGEVAFIYTYNNETYPGTNMTFCFCYAKGSTFDPIFQMVGELNKEVGKPITVWVDPDMPTNAVLFKWLPKTIIFIIGFGIFSACVFLYLMKSFVLNGFRFTNHFYARRK